MKIWKPMVKYRKFRDEFAYHADFMLEANESLHLFAGPLDSDDIELYEVCPEGYVWKIHLEIAIEPFQQEEIGIRSSPSLETTDPRLADYLP